MLAFLILLDTEEDRSDFEKMYDTYYLMVYRASYSVLQDSHLAQDSAQITFFKIAKKFKYIKTKVTEDEKGYIFGMAENTAIDLLRKERELLSHEDGMEDTIMDERALIEESLIRIENHQETIDLLDAINPSYAEFIYLKYYRELTNHEIADLKDITLNSVRVKLCRAIGALRTVMVKGAVENG